MRKLILLIAIFAFVSTAYAEPYNEPGKSEMTVDSVSSDLIPSTDNTYDLGSATYEWKDLYIDGTANLDTVDIDGNVTIQPATDSTTAVQILDADGGTPVFNVDTTNERTGFSTATPNTTVDIQGGQTVKVTTVNAATYDLLVTDYILNVTYTATGTVTSLTLPTAQVVVGRIITIKDAGGLAGTNNITVDTEGAETIDGAATFVLNTNYEAIDLYSDGSNWFAR